MTDWSDLVARVRGLSTHLLDPRQLRTIAESRGLAAVSVALAGAGVLPAPLERAGPRTLEQGIRRHAARQLRLVWRWAGERNALLAPLCEDEDRRTIRAMLRGASSGSPPDARLAGLVPTSSLPERVLLDLARLGDVATVAAQLAAIGSPYARTILEEASRQHPDLLRLECALNRTFAARAVAAGARADAPMRTYVAGILDVENCWTARLLPLGSARIDAAEFHVDGGRELSLETFVAAVAARATATRDEILRRAATSSWLQAATADAPRLEDAVLRGMIGFQHRLARQDPLGTAPVIEYVLRLRAQVRALQGVVWSVALRMPGPAIAHALEPAS